MSKLDQIRALREGNAKRQARRPSIVPESGHPFLGEATEVPIPLVRLIFPATPEMAKAIDAEWHKRGLRSRSETIRELLTEAMTK